MAKIARMLYSPSQRLCWEVDFFLPDDDHPEEWVYPFVSASWPSDWAIGPSYPYNTDGIDYIDDYDENGVLFWRVRLPDEYPDPLTSTPSPEEES